MTLEYIVPFTDAAAVEKFEQVHGTNGMLVRCRDCKHWWNENEVCTHDNHVHGDVCCHKCKADDFCADGERKESE